MALNKIKQQTKQPFHKYLNGRYPSVGQFSFEKLKEEKNHTGEKIESE